MCNKSNWKLRIKSQFNLIYLFVIKLLLFSVYELWSSSGLISSEMCVSRGGCWLNCALCDANLKFGTMIEYDLTNIFRNRAIADSSRIHNGGHFSKWPPTISISHLFQPLIVLES